MKSGLKVGDVMTRKFVFVSPKTKVIDCLKIMSKKDIGSLLIVEDKKLRGITTSRDIITYLAKNIRILQKEVKHIMKKNLITISPSKDISEAVELMEKKNVRKLPVVVKSSVVGFITKKDILKIRPGLFDILTQKIRIAEEQEKIKRIAQSESGKDHWVKEGECQECGAQDLLYQFNDRYVCALCKNNIKNGKREEIEEKEQHKIAHKIFDFLKKKEKEEIRSKRNKKGKKISKKKR